MPGRGSSMSDKEIELKKKHALSDCMYWNLFALVPLLVACVAVAMESIFWMIVYIIVIVFDFIIIEYRHFCSHCPHYINSQGTTKCMLLWGIPKFYEPKPGPLSNFEKFMMVLGCAVMGLFPLYWLLLRPYLLLIYLISWITLILTMKRYECCRCIYFHCPMNSVRSSRGCK